VVVVLGFGICSLGLQKGVERVTKIMMVALFALMIGLAVYSLTLSGAGEGLKFYLIPSFERMKDAGVFTVITAAMGQAFFTLSIGIGSIGIFGSYIGKDRRLLGETFVIVGLDTFVAIVAGLIVFPACFTYAGGVNVDANTVGAGFLFTTLSSIFNNMEGGRIIGTLFFLFMIFASMSTIIAVFENIMSFWIEKTKLKRWQIALINAGIVFVLSLPAVFSLNIWEEIKVLGMGFLDLEDFTVSNILLPFGSLIYVIFCTSRYGWGWNNYHNEVNIGNRGAKMPKWMRIYMTYALPIIIFALLVISNVIKFI
jgi:NSS family neurotransmitter:Na+ symporter